MLYTFLAYDLAYDIMDRTLESELDHLLWPLYYDFVDSLQVDETTDAMLISFNTWMDNVKLIGYTFHDSLDAIKLDLIADLHVDYLNYLTIVTPDDPYIELLMQFWTDMINASTNEVDAIANRFLGRTGIMEAIYEEVYMQSIAQLLVQYTYWQTIVGSAELPQLEVYYEYYLEQININKYWTNYDFFLAEFDNLADSLLS